MDIHATVDEARDGDVVLLPSSLDQSAAEPLCRMLLRHAMTADAVILDGGAVERVGTASVQVLVAAAADARARRLPFRLDRPSTILLAALADLGLEPELGS